jgi:GDP-L-fucose synthase
VGNNESGPESKCPGQKKGKGVKIYVAGHTGLVGSALVRAIESSNQHSWVGRTRAQLDLLDRNAVFEFLSLEKPDAVIVAAAKVGGIMANKNFPVDFLSQNLQITTNLLDGSHNADVPRLLFLASSCVYPKLAPQPIKETDLLTGPLEETNEAYAIAKIAGIKLVQAYRRQFGRDWISAMPTNLYGPGDNYDLGEAHVLPALIRRFHEAKESGSEQVTLWGTGSPLREFMHSDDLAQALLHLLDLYHGDEAINVGSGEEVSIKELARMVSEVVEFEGSIEWDSSYPNGTPRKLIDSSKLRELGWSPKISITEGIRREYKNFQDFG